MAFRHSNSESKSSMPVAWLLVHYLSIFVNHLPYITATRNNKNRETSCHMSSCWWAYVGIRYALEELPAVGCCQVLGLTILFELQLLLVVLGAGLKKFRPTTWALWCRCGMGRCRTQTYEYVARHHHTTSHPTQSKDMSIGSGGRSWQRSSIFELTRMLLSYSKHIPLLQL